MKKYFIFAAVALVALCNVSCSSSDDDDPIITPETKYEAPAAAAAATAFAIPSAAQQPTSKDGTTKLQQVDITESGKTVVKVDFKGDAKYLTFDSEYKKDGNKQIYTLFKDKQKKGTIESITGAASARRRALDMSNITISLEIEIPNEDGTVTKVEFEEQSVAGAQEIDQATATTNTVNICRTWTVEEMTMSLKDKGGPSKITDCTVTVAGGNLKELADKAQENNAGLTDKELKDLNKLIKGITLTKAGQLSIEYSTGLTDACTWTWANNEQTTVTIKSVEGEDFGNKFLNNDSKIAVKFYPSGIAHFSVTTTIDNRKDGNKKYFDATIDITLK